MPGKEEDDGHGGNNDSDLVAEAEADADTDVGDAAFREENLYCGLGDCLWPSRIPGHALNTA